MVSENGPQPKRSQGLDEVQSNRELERSAEPAEARGSGRASTSNLDHMPELGWRLGYPLAVAAMAAMGACAGLATASDGRAGHVRGTRPPSRN